MLGQKLYTSAVPPCLTLLRPLSLYVNTKVLLTQTSASYLHKEPFPLFGSPSEAHSHLFRIPAHTRRRLSEMLTQELLTLLHRFTTVNCNTAEPWCQGDRSKFSKNAEYLGDEQKKLLWSFKISRIISPFQININGKRYIKYQKRTFQLPANVI